MLKRIFLCCMILITTGCGFQLRGFVKLPSWLDNIAIVVESAHKDLAPMLRDQLLAYNLHLASDPTKASYLLILEHDINSQSITTVSSSTTPRQYILTYTVVFSLVKVGGNPIISSNAVTVNRQLTVNNDRILGSDSENVVILREMHRDAVRQIMNRISRKSAALPLAEVTGIP